MEIAMLILVAWVVVMYFGAEYMRKAAEAKGYGSEYNIFVICFLLGFFGYMYVLTLPDLILREQMKTIADRLNNQKQDEWSINEELPEL